MRIVFSFFIFYLISSLCFAEIKGVVVSPAQWTKQNYLTITIDTTYEVLDWEYLLDNNLNGEMDGDQWISANLIEELKSLGFKIVDGDRWKSANTAEPTFILENIETDEWEVWIRGKLPDESYTSPKMAKCYIDTSPPEEVKNISLKKIDNKIFVFWDEVKDQGSGLQRYDGKIEDKIVKDIKSGKWEIKPKSKEFEISIWAQDKVENVGIPTVFKKTKGTKIERIETKKKTSSGITLGNIDIQGYRTYTIRYASSGFAGTPGATTEQAMNLSLSGNVGRDIRATGTIEDMPYQDRRIIIELKGPTSYIKFGDFNAGMPFGEFSSVPSKTITGVEAGYRIKNVDLKFLTSEAKSSPRTETKYGSNIKGPYQFAPWVVEGSETIRVDDKDRGWYDRLLQRDVDYEINYFSGEIMFKEVMWSTTKITITYEFGLPFISRQGDLLALQGNLLQRNNYKANFIYLRETVPSSGGINKFYVRNEPHTVQSTDMNMRKKEYPLDGWPISDKSEFIYVNATTNIKTNYEFDTSTPLQGDYWVDYDRGTITFREDTGITPPITPPTEKDNIYASYTYYLAFTERRENLKTTTQDDKCYITIPSDMGITNEKRVRVWQKGEGVTEILLTPGEKESDPVGSSYKIYDTKIEFFSTTYCNGSTFIIEYKKVPSQDEKDNELKKEVLGITSDIKFGNITIQSEFARSQGDRIDLGTPQADIIYIKDISINDSIVTYCVNIEECKDDEKKRTNILGPYKLSSPHPIFQSPYDPITVEIIGLGLVIGSDLYIIKYNEREISFSQKENIQVNSQIKISYRYLTEKDLGGGITKTSGSAFKSSISSNFFKEKVGISTNLRFISPEFDPIGMGRIPAEKRGITSNLSYKLSRNVGLACGFSYSDREEKTLIGKDISTSITYPKYPTLRMTLRENQTKKEGQRESKNTSHNLDTTYKIGKWTLGGTTSQTTYTGTYKTKNLNNVIRAGIKPTRNIEFNSSFNTAKNKSAASTTTTNITDLGVMWTLAENYRINSKYNLQKVTSFTTTTEVITIDTNFNVAANTIKIKGIPTRPDPIPVTTLSGNYQVRKDLISAGGTDNTNYNLSFGFEPHKIVSTHTTYNQSKSKGQRGYQSTNDSFTLRSQIKPKSKNNLQITPSYSTSTNKSAATKTRSENYFNSLSFTPRKNLSVSTDANFENRKESKSRTFTLRSNYPLSAKMSLSLTYLNRGTTLKTLTTKKTSQDEINAGVNYKMGKNVTGSFDIRYVDYGDRPSGYNYTTRFETRF